MRYAQSVADLVGNTPLVQLNRVTDGIAATVLAKVEYFNPGGSAKDRIAARIIDAAERDGFLRPGGTTRLFQLAESLGGVESLMNYPDEMTHASVRGTELAVPPEVVRLSVGIETAADLLDDLDQALARL
ncbi:pyridoxal-phosphate dependent enzyme [Microbacterium sp. NEAU-LLC]|uniref:Pyridoxal-phosphate dependent enzyme n=1 Tax=Microbacterium helvum TaxID=2773713 RepID=A0ABR8NRG5_9MICO|nr:pyridoxal-phosphate dependent enzyme [Microbacterium helvum]